MKKLVIVLLLATLLVHMSSALTTTLRESYSQGETVIIEVKGNILDNILKEDVEIKRNNVRMPWTYDIKKLDGHYYLWANIPVDSTLANYTLYINDVMTTENGVEKEIDFSQNWSLGGNKSEYSIEPGFIWTNKDFKIDVTTYIDEDIFIQTDFPDEREIKLTPGKNTIAYSVKEIYGNQMGLIQVGKYIVPAYIMGSASAPRKEIIIEPYNIEEKYLIGEKRVYPVIIRNNGKYDLEDLQISYNKDLFSSTLTKSFSIKSGEYVQFNLSLKKENEERDVSEVLYIQSSDGNISESLPISLVITKNSTLVNEGRINVTNNSNTNNGSSNGLTCNNLGGYLCASGSLCSGNIVASSEGSCCIGICTEPETSNNSWIGYLVAAAILLLLFLIYYKYKKVKPESEPIKNKAAEFEKKYFSEKRIP